MKRKGFLDDVEKLVDDFPTEKKKEINTDVGRYEKDFSFWYNEIEKKIAGYKVERYQDNYIRAIEKRSMSMWDSPYTYPYGMERRVITTTHKCNCGLLMKLTHTKDEIDFNRHNPFYEHRKRMKHDIFYCPRCSEEVRVVGKLIELTVNMTE